MKTRNTTSLYLAPLCLTLGMLLGACSTLPASTTLLEQARADFRAAQANPAVTTHAALELQQAGVAVALANSAAEAHQSESEIDALAYVARGKIALSQEVAKKKVAEASVAGAGKERDQMRLAQRTGEADRANLDAAQANVASAAAQNRATQAQAEARDAERKTAEVQGRNSTLEAQQAELSAKKTERGIVITLGDVLFGVNEAALTAEGGRTVQKLAAIMQQNPSRTVMVEGYTDSTGSQAHNQSLSERRASAVGNALRDMGVASERIGTRGFGESNPVAPNGNAQERQLNRRVEIVLSGENGKIAGR